MDSRGQRKTRVLDCPMPGCQRQAIVRLDRHLYRLHQVKSGDPAYARLMAEAKSKAEGDVSFQLPKRPVFVAEEPGECELPHSTLQHSEESPSPGLDSLHWMPLTSPEVPSDGPIDNPCMSVSETDMPGEAEPETIVSSTQDYLPDAGSEDGAREELPSSSDGPSGAMEGPRLRTLSSSQSSLSSSNDEDYEPMASHSGDPSRDDVRCLRLYREYLLGPKPHAKKLENTNQALQHIRRFLWCMADAPEGEVVSEDLGFLSNTERCHEWYRTLSCSSMSPSTIHSYVNDVVGFIRYLLEARLSDLKVKKRTLSSIAFFLKSFRRQGHRELMLHRQKVQDARQEQLIPKEHLKRFNERCGELIPQMLELCEKGELCNVGTLIGLLCGRMMLHNGHRRGVLMNMKAGEVEGAKQFEDNFHIRVSDHKTAGTYGVAVMVVSKQEHDWLLRYSALRVSLPGYLYQPKTFFFTRLGNPLKKIGNVLSKAWAACDIGVKVTAGMIRSAVATYTWESQGEVSKSTVSRHMSHSLQTQASFYVHDQAPANHQRARLLIEESLGLSPAL
ncbi:uncharacterized protein LOC121306029 [Polyodon spathula]|uniref:uncharacterized protein LOC121306029 n=1 Tax=Polyodon spathula TaxID=7913 RepID=UPI001B7EB3BE|nr:uncharacterized protein LOC121306029 [Polyodon spathula]